MESIGFDPARDDPVYPDIAFRLPAPASTRPRASDGLPHTVGVGLMTYRGWDNDTKPSAAIYAAYLEKMTRFVVWLLDRGHVVRLLMGDEADRRTVDDLMRNVRSIRPDCTEDVLLFTPARTLHDIMRQVADTDVVVATRYHNVVCALRMGRPTISIGYADKNDALLAEMGLADYCQSIEELDLERLKAQTTRLLADRVAIAHRVRETGKRFDRRLQEQEDLIASLIFDDSGPVQAPRPCRREVLSPD